MTPLSLSLPSPLPLPLTPTPNSLSSLTRQLQVLQSQIQSQLQLQTELTFLRSIPHRGLNDNAMYQVPLWRESSSLLPTQPLIPEVPVQSITAESRAPKSAWDAAIDTAYALVARLQSVDSFSSIDEGRSGKRGIPVSTSDSSPWSSASTVVSVLNREGSSAVPSSSSTPQPDTATQSPPPLNSVFSSDSAAFARFSTDLQSHNSSAIDSALLFSEPLTPFPLAFSTRPPLPSCTSSSDAVVKCVATQPHRPESHLIGVNNKNRKRKASVSLENPSLVKPVALSSSTSSSASSTSSPSIYAPFVPFTSLFPSHSVLPSYSQPSFVPPSAFSFISSSKPHFANLGTTTSTSIALPYPALNGKYSLYRTLQQSLFGCVKLARSLGADKNVAIKISNKQLCMTPSTTTSVSATPSSAPSATFTSAFGVSVLDNTRRESDVMKFIQTITEYSSLLDSSLHPGHKNLAHIVEELSDHSHHYLITEHCGFDLFSLCSSFPHHRLPEIIARCYFKQLMQGVQYLHQHCGVAHLDISCENICVELDTTPKSTDLCDNTQNNVNLGRLRIIDFGVAAIHPVIANVFNRPDLTFPHSALSASSSPSPSPTCSSSLSISASLLSSFPCSPIPAGGLLPGKLHCQSPELHDHVAFDAFSCDIFACGDCLILSTDRSSSVSSIRSH